MEESNGIVPPMQKLRIKEMSKMVKKTKGESHNGKRRYRLQIDGYNRKSRYDPITESFLIGGNGCKLHKNCFECPEPDCKKS